MTNVGSATITIVPSAKGFSSALSRDIDGPLVTAGSRGGKKAGAAAGAGIAGGILPMVGRAVPALAAAFAGLQIGKFAVDAIGSASDLQETMSKTATVLGKKATPAVVAYGDAAAKTFGLSKKEALDAVSTFAIFGKSAGLAGKPLGKFGTDLTTLAADFASFYNTSPEDAIVAIGAALRGENEGIRRYGVLLDNATLQNRAFKMGLTQSNKQALTPQQKVLAAQAEILRQSKVAQGDVARTSGGLANTQRRLSAGFENLKASVGAAFLPLATKIVGIFADKILPAVTTVVDALAPAFAAVGDAIGSIFGGGGADKAKGAIDGIGSVFSANEGTFSTFAEIAKTIGDILSTVGGIIRDDVAPVVAEVAGYVGGALSEAFAAVGDVLRDPILPALQDLAAKFREFAPKIAPVVSGALKLWAAWAKLYYGALGPVLAVIIKIAGFLLGQFINSISGVIMAVQDVIGWFSTFRDAMGRLPAAVREKIEAVKGFFRRLPGAIRAFFAGAPSWLYNAGADVVRGLINGIKSLASAPVEAIGNIASNVINGAKGILGINSPSKVFAEIGKFVGEGFVKGLVASQREVVRTMGKLAELVAKTGKKSLEKIVRADEKRLVKLAGRRDKILKDLAGTKSRLDELQSDKDSYFGSVKSGLLDAGTLANNGGSFDAIVRRLQTASSVAKRFGGQLSSLKAAGVSDSLVKQIGELGADEGGRTAGLILSKGADGIALLNSLQADLEKSSQATARTSAEALYDGNIRAARGTIKGLKDALPEINALMKKVAESLAKAIRTAIGAADPAKGKGGGSVVASASAGSSSPVRAATPARASAVVPNGALAADRSVTVNVHNPVPERASVSVQRKLANLAYLGI